MKMNYEPLKTESPDTRSKSPSSRCADSVI